MTNDMELYFHIPFCVRKCYYCDFLSAPADEGTKTAYMAALQQEVLERAPECKGRAVTSLFFGGGTPSTVEAEQLAGLLQTVKEQFALAEDAEITVEVNPGTVDRRKLEVYRRAGVNRLSIGLQSADDRELETVGRIHTWEQFREAWQAAAEAGFKNLNVDVMSALPGQTCESFLHTLESVLALRPAPAHISAYSLIPEEGTPLMEQIARGRLVLPDEDADREMYRAAKRVLGQAGYRRYEISNYARPGYECRHNCGYWSRRDYLGFGIGAASLMDTVRFKNGSDLQAYLRSPAGCREEVQSLSPGEQMEEFLFLGLRMTEGVSAEEFADCFGEEMDFVYGEVIRRNTADGLLEWRECGNGQRLALTERGLDLANYVMAQFLL